MNFSLTLLSAMAFFLVAAAQIVGGKYPVNPTGADVVKAANFALSDRYVLDDIQYKILSAESQALGSLNFHLTISVAETQPTCCTVMRYTVLKEYGATDSYTIIEDPELSLNYKRCAWLPAA